MLQIIITIVFFDSLWIKANKGMTRSLVSEIRTLYDVYRNPDMGQKQTIIDLYNKNFDFVISYKQNEPFPKIIPERWYSPMDRSLRRELKNVFGNSYWFDTTTYKEVVDLRIKYQDWSSYKYFFQKKNCAIVCKNFCIMDNFTRFSFNFNSYSFFKKSNSPNN